MIIQVKSVMFIRHKGRTLRKKDRQGQKSTMYNYNLIQTTTNYHQKHIRNRILYTDTRTLYNVNSIQSHEITELLRQHVKIKTFHHNQVIVKSRNTSYKL